MKKLFLLLLVVALAAFLFVGCIPTTPGEGEDEGEGEGEPEVSVILEGSYKIGGIDYVKGKTPITVTFSAPVEGIVTVHMENCYDESTSTFLFPNADKTVWTGSIDFGCKPPAVNNPPCCQAIVTIESGACEVEECLVFPVVVDCEPPEIDLLIKFLDCGDPCDPCEESAGAYFEFTSEFGGTACNPEGCCSDDCSCVADWSFVIDKGACAEDCVLAEGTDCPVEGETNCECLPYPAKDTAEYVITFTIADCVGNKTTSEFTVVLDTDEVISFNGVDVDMKEWIEWHITGICVN